jgi:5-methylcytosine-specific restriction protein A
VPNWRAVHRDTPPRIRGTHLQRLRRQLFERQPLCVVCEADGRVTIATIRDHVVPLGEGGTDTDSNTQALCQSCSDRKTREEAKRGMQRAK